MNDRELLELAAKAIGGSYWHDARTFSDYLVIEQDEPVKWNPLTDDGDALRLAVKLKVGTRFTWCGRDDQHDSVWAEHGRICCDEDIGITPSGIQLDEMAATRRAIVRAAAEIWKAMP